MKYIDKKNNTTLEQSFNHIVDNYISRGEYRYDQLMDDDRKSLRNLLEQEQSGLCAYCMRRVIQGERTIDHIIPKYIERSRYSHAYKIGCGLYKTNILYEKIFTKSSIPIYYPHTLSYGNMVLACENCNLTKSDDIIFPFFFDASGDHINYTEKGRMEISSDKVFPNELKSFLNQDFYSIYRSIWRAVKISGLSVQEMKDAKDTVTRQKLLNVIKKNVSNPIFIKKYPQLVENFTVTSKWNDFLRYDWFWEYY